VNAASRHIVACGGALFGDPATLRRYVLALTGKERPRVCLIPTASGDRDESIVRFYELIAPLAEVSHLGLFRRTVADVHAHLLAQDAVLVAGGNTASMLAVWRAHGVDTALRAAWEQGVVLAGTSAGALCWFEDGVTDSYGPELAALGDGLGFLQGSFCPHYDTEPERRPRYRALVASGEVAPGLAAEDLVALHFVGTELAEIVAAESSGEAFRVDREGEHPLDVRVLPA
jgi:peptidase E